MPAETPPTADASWSTPFIVWIAPERALQPGINRFEVQISDAGDTWLDRLRW